MIHYCDQMTIRFSPSIKERAKGLLKPVKPHRDTWASNFQHQINWWIPLHDLSKQILFFSFQNILQKKLKIIQKNGILNYLKKDI